MSDLLKPCIVCGVLSKTIRCPEHTIVSERYPKGNTTQRGYGHAWQKLSKRARRLQPFCLDCGSTEDLQCDHSPEAWERFEAGKPVRLQDVAVVCGPCNRRRGQARPVDKGGDKGVRKGHMAPGARHDFPLTS